MDDANAVTLTVDGLEYRGWKTVEIAAGIERQVRDFRIGITWRWPGQDVARPIRQGARCEVRIGRDLVLTGWVDATPTSYDNDQISTEITGRSLTADVVDCAAINKPGQWSRQGMLAIVGALVQPYGIAVRSEVSETSQLLDHTIEPGETVFDSIDRLITAFRLFSTDDAQGRLLIASPGSEGRAVDTLRLGANILTCSATLDFSGVFSEYRVIGQRSGDDDTFGEAAAEIKATVADNRVKRRRVLVIHESGQMTQELAQSRANWERGHRMGDALTITYTVQGWRQSNGALWRHNMIVRVIDPVLGMDRDMLIAEITYSLNDHGTITKLVVGPPDGYDPEPFDPHKKRKLKGDGFEYLLPADWEKKEKA